MGASDGLRDEHGGFEVQTQPTQLLRHGTAEQSQGPGLLHELGHEPLLLRVDAVEHGHDPFLHEFEGHLLHHQLFLGPFFGDEDVLEGDVADQKFSAADGLLGHEIRE